jgi:hypothetical protein
MPLHFLCSLYIPPGILKQFDMILRQCLWKDKDNPKPSFATCELLCKPKDKGGVSIVDFRKQNEALLLKHLNKFFFF